jgi:Spy/CpxP family protein refolding chaperone
MMAAHQAISAALEGEAPDWEAYEESLRAAADIMVQTHLAMARAAKEARDVLTAEQREELEAHGLETMRGMMHRMFQNGPGGMLEHGR